MKEKIGKTAGRIWQTLGKKNEVNVSQLPRILRLEPDVVHQALGWLAREDKIDYRTKGKRTIVSLADAERKIFQIQTRVSGT